MDTALIVVGALLELVGLSLVFYELVVVTNRDVATLLGDPDWWRVWFSKSSRGGLDSSRFVAWFVSMSLRAAGAIGWAPTEREKKRPVAAMPGASDRERIDRLEEYVLSLDVDLDAAWRELEDRTRRLSADAATAESEALTARFSSYRRQAIGATCVLLGLVLGTIGNLV